MRERRSWIDILRGIAICAVVIDHGIFLFFYSSYHQNIIWLHTYFSITWFVLLSGVANTLSANKGKWILPFSYLIFWKKRSAILAPYILASVMSYLILSSPITNLNQLLYNLLFFSAQPTFYFINLILQLYLVFPFLYHLVTKCKTVWRKILFTAVMIIVTLLISRVNPPWIFAVPGKLFGGIYLFVFVLGILYAEINFKLNPLLLIVSFILFAGYEFILLSTRSSFATNLSIIIWSVSSLVVTNTVIVKYITKLSLDKILGYLGRHSLFIFLFHYLYLKIFQRVFYIEGIEVLILMIAAIYLSLLTEYLYQYLTKGFIPVLLRFATRRGSKAD